MKKTASVLVIFLFSSLVWLAFSVPLVMATADSWTTMEPMPTARSRLGVVAVNGKIYAIGGEYGDVTLRTNEMYDPTTNTWTMKTSMPTARSSFAITVYQGKIYVMGGKIGSGELAGQYLVTGANEVYDPATDSWETKTSMPTPRQDLGAQTINDKIYTLSGVYYENIFLIIRHDETEIYDPATDSWTTAASIPLPVWSYASSIDDNKIYVIGGWNMTSSGANTAHSTQMYDLETNTWSHRATPEVALSRSAADTTTGSMAPKRIYVLGGMDRNHRSDLTQIYNPLTNSWSFGKPMPTNRAGLGVVAVNDTLYAIGGSVNSNNTTIAVATNERYTPFGFSPPYPYIYSPKNIIHNTDSVELVFTLNEPASLIYYNLNGQTNVTISGNVTLSDLADDFYSVMVYAKNLDGSWIALEPAHFSVDTTPPEITKVVQAPFVNEVQPTDSVVVNASVFDELSGIKRVTLKYTATSTTRYLGMANLEGNIWTGTIPAFSNGTEITYAIIAEDNGGNTIATMETDQIYEYQVIPEFPSSTPLLITLFAVVAVTFFYTSRIHKHKPRSRIR